MTLEDCRIQFEIHAINAGLDTALIGNSKSGELTYSAVSTQEAWVDAQAAHLKTPSDDSQINVEPDFYTWVESGLYGSRRIVERGGRYPAHAIGLFKQTQASEIDSIRLELEKAKETLSLLKFTINNIFDGTHEAP